SEAEVQERHSGRDTRSGSTCRSKGGPKFKRGILDETPVPDQPAVKKPRPRWRNLLVTPETPQVSAPQPAASSQEETPQAPARQPVRRRLRKPIEETPQAPAPQPVRRRLKKPIE
ncbi:MAG: hypothetical protein ACKPKO_24035, partial [Candidatus Fonsibacter sp.]